jgi:hypothetical protein
MPRALAAGGAAVAGFGPPWLAVVGVAVVSVWAITLAVLLCGHSSGEGRKKRTPFSGATAGHGGGGCGGGGGGCGGGGGGGC